MKSKILISIFFLNLSLFGQSTNSENFTLKFFSVGYGSNMNQAQPVFIVEGNRFIYTNENAWTDSNNFFTEFNDTISFGKFRASSIDSIISLVERYKGTVIVKSNPEVMSGGSDNLIVNFNGNQTEFKLDNAYDPTLYQIVIILNTYVHDKDKKIWVYEKEIKNWLQQK